MAPCVKMSFSEVRALARNLNAIHDEFENAGSTAAGAAELTGDEGLSQAVTNFADRWRINRESMLENLVNLQQMVEAIVDTFTDVDCSLDDALAGACEPGVTRQRGGEHHG